MTDTTKSYRTDPSEPAKGPSPVDAAAKAVRRNIESLPPSRERDVALRRLQESTDAARKAGG